MLDSYHFGLPADAKSLWSMRLRWMAAALLVTTAHAAVLWLAVSWRPAHAEEGEPAQAVIELAALPAEPEAAELDLPPAPELVQSEPTPIEEPTREETAAEATPVEPQPTEHAAAEPETPVEAGPVPEVVTVPTPVESDVVVAPVKKVETRKPDPRPDPKPDPKPVAKPEAKQKPKEAKREIKQPVKQAERPERTTAPRAAAPRAAAVASQATGAPSAAAATTSGASLASWRGSLIAHLNRHKRFPPGANSAGAASVSFTIDRSGRVLSANLVRSSGDTMLDGEAMAMMRRASPVPQPPADVGGRTISLAVPVRFNR